MKRNKSTRKVKPLKPFLIGRYQLGWRMVQVYAEPANTGATFNLCRHESEAEIHCGMDVADPAQAFSWLCHEVWEMVMDDMMVCFRPKAFEDLASDVYHFAFNHNQHTEISARASYFIWRCSCDFTKAHALCLKNKAKRST